MDVEEPKSKHPEHFCWFSSRDLTATCVCLQTKIERKLASFFKDYLKKPSLLLLMQMYSGLYVTQSMLISIIHFTLILIFGMGLLSKY